jgi:PilZ domain-containing protein
MKTPRSRRYSFVADIELTDVKSDARTRERTSDLSVFGCHVETRKPLSNGAKVRVRITHRGATFVALGRVSYAIPNSGMGIVFTNVQPGDELILEKWIAEMRDKEQPRRDEI